jgi:hypothetical protein
VLRWWDGTAWASMTSWPAPAPAQPAPRGRVSAWLTSPAASPLLAVIAAVTAIGWAGGAIAMAAAAVARPVLPAVTLDVSGFVLPVADIAVWIGVQACRAGCAGPARPAGAARAMRRAARQARWASSGPWVAVQAARWLVRRRRRVFASLPRPVAWFYAAAIWLTAGACPWVIFEGASHGWYRGNLEATAAGLQLAALVWMVHLITWSGMACRRLDRTRAAARMMPLVRVTSR